VPWTLDPVLADRSTVRADAARAALARRPAVVRCNADEARVLAPGQPATAARRLGSVLARTGMVDAVSDGARTVALEGGHPLMDRVTGVGCVGSALVAAFLAVTDDPLIAAAAAIGHLGLAGEIAAADAALSARLQTMVC
jgi:hydroxyethylthiazole kinase